MSETTKQCPICRRSMPAPARCYQFRGLTVCSLICRVLITSPHVKVTLPELELAIIEETAQS